MRRAYHMRQSFPIPSAPFIASLRTTLGSTRAPRTLVPSHPCRRDDLLRHPNAPRAPPVPSVPPPAYAAHAAFFRHRSPHTTHPQRSVSAGGAAARRSSAQDRRPRAAGKYPTAVLSICIRVPARVRRCYVPPLEEETKSAKSYPLRRRFRDSHGAIRFLRDPCADS
ncbi:hypothetical protein DFH08DRAFT_837017 [Mycena albidolilacea]|uniref:Uncharacterized protein n=1 Tax=Mycena albidolilacea TaxID=1033008 RepID=A0AAD7ASP7_9AGAR|nr:hypothetical protein DFH08DRAFT_837017 [Mycena albidolilacea]